MRRPFAFLVLAAGTAVAADVVILPDGFSLQGKHFKEKELVVAPGAPGLVMDKANGFDLLDDGPRTYVFSRHANKGGKIEEGAARPEYTPLKQPLAGRKGTGKNLSVLNPTRTQFDAKWMQTIKGMSAPSAELPNGAPTRMILQITRLDPYLMQVESTTHYLQPRFQTSEYPPDLVRGLLGTHPTLADPKGKADPARRLQIASWLKDVSLVDPSANGAACLLAAKQELDRLKADVPAGLAGDAAARADKLRDEIAVAETRRVNDEVDAALSAGRWQYARSAVTGFTPSQADAKELGRFAALKARVDDGLKRFDQTARLLDQTLQRVGGSPELPAFAGGLAVAVALAGQSPAAIELFAAGTAVRAELHPDTVTRLELFISQADDKRRFAAGQQAKPDALLALAVSGYLKGKNGADLDPAVALAAWDARRFALNYLTTATQTERLGRLAAYTAGRPAGDELIQVVQSLPPPEPLTAADLTPLPPTETEQVPNLLARVTPSDALAPRGVGYVLRLPAEWHPGRTYPVVVALCPPTMPPARMIAYLQEYADRHGYVVAAPRWGAPGQAQYDYRGLAHPAVTLVLRDLFRRLRCDPDRVFAYGYGPGADFALDVGLSHPDLFAGVIANGATPPDWLSAAYWRNAQKLPFYFLCGDLGAEYPAVRRLFEKWMPRGYPALAAVFRGRAAPDFFTAEQPRVFDWMGRKSRVRGAASLKLGGGGVDPWQVLREADDRFYWVGVGAGGLNRQNLLVNRPAGALVDPPRFKADIGRNGAVEISEAIGVRKFVVWLERDLIDWAKPLAITVNGKVPIGYKPRQLKPDVGVMLEELYRTGDTKMLFLGKVEIDGPG